MVSAVEPFATIRQLGWISPKKWFSTAYFADFSLIWRDVAQLRR